METVKNVAEAEAYFAANEGKEVICENDNKVTKVVSNLEDAKAFFEETAATGTDTAAAGDAGTQGADTANAAGAGEGEADRG